MLTLEQIRENFKHFDSQYPDSLPDRLRWWTHTLGIDPGRLVRLLSRTTGEGTLTPDAGLEHAIAQREFWAEFVESQLGRALEFYHYDLAALREILHPSEPAKELVGMPYYPRPEEREAILLHQIFYGGRDARCALLAYLSEPGTSG
jgi:hypothetical protein